MSKKRTITIISVLLLVVGLAGAWQSAPVKAQQSVEGDPAAALGKPTGQDKFDSANNWTLFDSQCFKSEIKNGQYVMTAKGSKAYSCWEVTWPLLQDFYMEVQATTPQSCNANDAYGFYSVPPIITGVTCMG